MTTEPNKILYTLSSLAKTIHGSQYRKVTGEPYSVHLSSVAGIAQTYYHLVENSVSLDVFLGVCWMHDAMEDQDITEDLLIKFAEVFTNDKDREDFVNGVKTLSDLEKGNREERKRLTIKRLGAAPAWIQLIKCADTENNSISLRVSDPDFFYSTMVHEKIELLSAFSDDIAVVRDQLLKYLQTCQLVTSRGTFNQCQQCEQGHMFECIREVPYRNKDTLLRSLKNMRGLYCSFCGNHDHTHYPESLTAIENMERKGGKLIPLTL